jgi:hypothetical protein
MYGEGARMTVPGTVTEVLTMERKAAEVDSKRFGGAYLNTFDFYTKK